MKDAILVKLAEVEAMLLEATCDGVQLAELECFNELENAMSTLLQTVDYYVAVSYTHLTLPTNREV